MKFSGSVSGVDGIVLCWGGGSSAWPLGEKGGLRLQLCWNLLECGYSDVVLGLRIFWASGSRGQSWVLHQAGAPLGLMGFLEVACCHLGLLGCLLDGLWVFLGCAWASLGNPATVPGWWVRDLMGVGWYLVVGLSGASAQFGGLLGGRFVASWALFWASWGPLGASWGPLGGL